MEQQYQYLIEALRSGLTGAPFSLPADADIEPLLQAAVRHHVSGILYQALFLAGRTPADPAVRRLLLRVGRYISVSETQMAEIDRICETFRQHGIDYMPLKGTVLRGLYPSPEMREMGDADILIRMEQYAAIPPLLEGLGYTANAESDHEYIWNKPGALHLELHKRLIPSYNTDYYAFFGDGWERARPVTDTPHEYRFTPEDEYIYLFTHFTKHYRDGGVGLKHVADLWLYRKVHPDLDTGYVDEQLRTLRLDEFHGYFKAMLQAWFADGSHTPQTELMTRFICDSGAFGTAGNHSAAEALRAASINGDARQVIGKKLRQSLFPSLAVLQDSWPVLKKAPFLLPFVWVARGCRAVLFRRRQMTRRLSQVKGMTADTIETYEQALRFVGLEFRLAEEDV